MNQISIYIHIPFCIKRCHYCDFYFITNEAYLRAFLNALKKEINAKIDSSLKELETVYFGGGTPSILKPQQIEDILNSIQKKARFSSNIEITLEANPEHINTSFLQDLKIVGINRISLGVQAFSSRKLKNLSRQHTQYQSKKSLENALNFIPNTSVDLIFGESTESLVEWKNELNILAKFEPSHVSTYGLTVEKNTILEKLIQQRKKQPPRDDVQAKQFLLAMEVFEELDYDHYEVSNFAKKGYRSKHNQNYWNRKPYLGFGPSAHSFINETRFANRKNIKAYIDKPENAVDFQEVLTKEKIKDEVIMLSLRQKEGLKLKTFERLFFDKKTRMNKYEELRYLEKNNFLQFKNDAIRLTPKGFVFADSIIGEILS